MRCLESMKSKIIVITLVFLVIVVATLYGVRMSISVIEIISGYVTLFFLLAIAIIDMKTYTIPNKILLVWLSIRSILVFLGFVVYGVEDVLVSSVIGALVVGLFFLITHYLSKRSLGGGDVKLSFVLGFSLTVNMVFAAVFYALLACGIFSLIGLATKKLTRKDAVPLGPFFFVGTVVAYLLSIF